MTDRKRCQAKSNLRVCNRFEGHRGDHLAKGYPTYFWNDPEDLPPTFGQGPQPDVEGMFNVISLRERVEALEKALGDTKKEAIRLLLAYHLSHETKDLTVPPIKDCPHPLCREAARKLLEGK